MYKPVMNDINGPDNFMIGFAELTIPGASFDSSARSPPPRCHPGTRLAILQRALAFSADRQRNKKMLWIVGPAGVGKSAIMQTLAENVSKFTADSVVLGASLFLSVNGRNDGSKALATLAYQIAVRNLWYRQFIQDEVMNDPMLLEKSLPTQFSKFLVEPFLRHAADNDRVRFLILIDGLDECNGSDTQCEILGLIAFFCIQYPNAPLVWIVSSRPEPHITAFLSRANVASGYEKEEILINSDEAREDVERYLREELGKLRYKYLTLALTVQWPAEDDFLKLSAAADGLFAFASTTVRFIDDPASGNPVSQLGLVLEAIDHIPSPLNPYPIEGASHPMAMLDALYARVLSRVPPHVLPATKKLLLAIHMKIHNTLPNLCNWLGMTRYTAYSALHHLHSVLDIPTPGGAPGGLLQSFHKSFYDYLFDFKRSGMFRDHEYERAELEAECVQRIFNEILSGMNDHSGPGNPGTDGILVSWYYRDSPDLGGFIQNFLRHRATSTFLSNIFQANRREFWNRGFTHILKLIDISYLLSYGWTQNLQGFRDGLFDETRRAELKEYCVLSEIPIGKIETNNIDVESHLFRCESWSTHTPASDFRPVADDSTVMDIQIGILMV
ncbi:hypothetical protein P691DRAFT_498084 [Macrolepiota fuliginosa MF-IS2]|uniref:NACHT domain-containing protein n=1 Tax=Macrolepiota fuliginosa MF-IS2 TaxID=1400762 RepID=A0A9P6C6H4_9AGAR|nr:hypothetical protein P691DRAFT_498084 [Macrolepiota fuliginosa MF-IS2]